VTSAHGYDPPMRTGREAADLPEILAFMQGLWAVVHRMERLSKQMGARTGITGPQRLVVRLIGLFPGMSAGDLATTLHLHPSTVTGVLKRLEEQGVVSRTTDPADGRRTVLRLTRRGVRVARGQGGTVEAALAAAVSGSSAQQMSATQAFLEEFARCLDSELARESSSGP
jgi:MarR family transcriptional regulator, organic hydroperoxide resistance regulator